MTGARAEQLLLLSAATEAELRAETERLVAHLAAHPDASLAELARTLVAAPLGRHRRMVVCRTAAEARHALPEAPIVAAGARPPRVVMLFTGEPARPMHGARALYDREPRFREAIDAAASALAPRLGVDVRAVLYGDADEPRFARAALFALEHALAQLWLSWGVAPAVTLAYGAGEVVAACLAGASALEDAAAALAGPPGIYLMGALWELLADPDAVLLEVGPGWTLTALARKHPRAAGRTIVSSLGARPWSPRASMLEALGALAVAGVAVDWAAVHGAGG